MESLDSKLCRLTAEQQKEVEDFVDFLLQRTGNRPAADPPLSAPPAPVAAAPPALTAQDTTADSRMLLINELIEKPDMPPAHPAADPATLLIREIAAEQEDLLSAEYMDYGKFEPAPAPPPSPATEAIQRVRIKLSGKNNNAPSDDLLDWIG
jgi:hypothetical protein